MNDDEIAEVKQKKNETASLLKNTKDVIPAGSEAKIKENMENKQVYVMMSPEELEDIRSVIAERKLGGRSEAGILPKRKDPEEEKKLRINEYLKSTGFKIR